MKLILIHGRDQQGQDPQVLRSTWEAALEKGFDLAKVSRPPSLEVCFPFYGDRLAELVKKLDEPILHDILTRGEGQIGSETAALQAQMLQEIAESPVSPISDTDIQAQLTGKTRTRDVQNWAWVIALAKAMDNTPLGGRTVDLVTHDVAVYLSNNGVRAQINSIVTGAFGAGPCVVVGHSLGSVVGYNLLRGLEASRDVRLYVTVGSPLGLNAIHAKLGQPPCVMPSCARTWINARDPKDIVAAYPLDSKHFNIAPPVSNYSTVDNRAPNHHSISGYLDDVSVAKAIHAALVP